MAIFTRREWCEPIIRKFGLVRWILPNQQDPRGKWAPNWQGLYVVMKAFSSGALILIEMDGNELPSPINSDAVKKYYA